MFKSTWPRTSHHGLPTGAVSDALAPGDIITVAGSSLDLAHGQVTVGVGHGQPAEHDLVGRLPQGALVLTLHARPCVLAHLVVGPPAAVIAHLG